MLAGVLGEQEVSVRLADGVLSGTWLQPDPCHAACVLIAGSGPTNRDGHAGNGGVCALRALAEALCEHGIASVRYDKRGVAKSRFPTLVEADLRFDHFVEDAVTWVHWLRERVRLEERVDSVTLVGHSEGGTIALAAANRIAEVRVVAMASPATSIAAVLRAQLEALLPTELYAIAVRILAQLEAGRDAHDVPSELHAVFRDSVQPYLRSWISVDPLQLAQALGGRLLCLHGGADSQISLEHADLFEAAAPTADVVRIKDMRHDLSTENGELLSVALTASVVRFLRGCD